MLVHLKPAGMTCFRFRHDIVSIVVITVFLMTVTGWSPLPNHQEGRASCTSELGMAFQVYGHVGYKLVGSHARTLFTGTPPLLAINEGKKRGERGGVKRMRELKEVLQESGK